MSDLLRANIAIRKVEIERYSVTSSKPFERILQKLEVQIGHPDMSAFAQDRQGVIGEKT